MTFYIYTQYYVLCLRATEKLQLYRLASLALQHQAVMFPHLHPEVASLVAAPLQEVQVSHTMPSQKHTTYLQKSRWQVNLHPHETVRHMHTAAGPLPQAHPTANPAADLCCEPRKGLGVISLSHTVRQMKAKRSIF